MPIRPQDPTRTPTRTTVYDQEYFSSSQTNLYIGDVLIDELVGLQFAISQRKRPIYGYASQLFDALAKATVIVEGSFEINFKESGYLFTVLNRFNRLNQQKGTPLISPFISTKQLGTTKIRGASREAELGGVARANIERVLNADKELLDGTLTREQLTNHYQNLAALHNELSGFNNPQGALPIAENIFEEFENQVWGTDPLTDTPRRTDDSAFDGFTIYITYGDFNSNDRINHTVERIDFVGLTGKSKLIMLDGNPIREQYTFLARNAV
jgi:hypothetical protein